MSVGWSAGAFLLVWLPYIASTYLAERLEDGGLLSQALMLLAFAMLWPASRLARSGFGLAPGYRAVTTFVSFMVLGLALALVRWKLSVASGAAVPDGHHALAAGTLAAAAGIAFVPTVTEDVLTRGFPLFAWRRRRSLILILFSAGLYTVNHLWRFDWGWTEQARLFAMGLAYAAVAAATGSLWSAVGFHLAGNIAPTVLARFAASPTDVAADRLVSAGLHLLVAVLFGALAWYRRRHIDDGQVATGHAEEARACD